MKTAIHQLKRIIKLIIMYISIVPIVTNDLKALLG